MIHDLKGLEEEAESPKAVSCPKQEWSTRPESVDKARKRYYSRQFRIEDEDDPANFRQGHQTCRNQLGQALSTTLLYRWHEE